MFNFKSSLSEYCIISSLRSTDSYNLQDKGQIRYSSKGFSPSLISETTNRRRGRKDVPK